MRLASLIACALAASCGGSQLAPPSDPPCVHPCDLNQSVQVRILGDEPAAAVTVTSPCGGGVPDCGEAGCRAVNLYLADTAPGGDAPKVCHVTAVSWSGVAVERDVTATYQALFCCPGYEFAAGASIVIDFSLCDAGITDGSSDAVSD